uniref:NADH dehydrogenase subunit 6 n=1 Tax=Trimerodytes annularis TaxID=2678873 RepID=UPI0020281244|nr:NADH dehydrogenase subunit 6 [Trimerodytes annularis]UQT68002.1 NADH dehydrogenase subunit 6 [Trimerodytes annularis]
MIVMNYMLGLVLVFVIFGVVVLGMTFIPYQGVISLMGISFFCCVFMVILGRTFAALVMYIVYLGGLVVVFGYCVSVEKDESDVFEVVGYKYFVVFMLVGVVMFLWSFGVGGSGDLLVYFGWEDLLCTEINGAGVFYFDGGWVWLFVLGVCSVVLFSILVILSWSRVGGLRPF